MVKFCNLIVLIVLTVEISILNAAKISNHPFIENPQKVDSNSRSLKLPKTLRKVKLSTPYSLTGSNSIENSKSVESVFRSFGAPSTVIGGALAHLALGTLYCWGNFLSYAPSYLRFYDGMDRKGAQPDALIILPLTILSMCITMPFGPMLVSSIGASKTLLLGSWITALGVFLASFSKNLYAFIAFYALMFGGGVGLAYTSPMIAGWKWLPNQKGLVSGIILTGFGAGGFFFNLIGTKFVNPKGLDAIGGKFPEEVYSAFPSMLRKLSAIYAVLTLIGSVLVSEPIVTAPAPALQGKVMISPQPPVPGLSVMEALKTSQFWLVWLMIISSASAGLNVASVYKQFAAGAPALSGDGYQALVGGIGALFNGVGRLFWGSISDKIGFKASFISLTLLQSVLHLLYPYSSSSKVFRSSSSSVYCYF